MGRLATPGGRSFIFFALMIRLSASSRTTQAATPASDGGGAPTVSSRPKQIREAVPTLAHSVADTIPQKADLEPERPPEQFCIFSFEDESELEAKPLLPFKKDPSVSIERKA